MGLLLFAILGIALAVAGFAFLKQQKATEEHESLEDQERIVLDLIERGGGEVTAGAVAKQLSMRTSEAESLLERLTEQRAITPELGDHGEVIYRSRT